MAYIALSGAENCGPDQIWDPNVEFAGQKGQCMPRKNYTAAQIKALEQQGKSPGLAETLVGTFLSAFLPKPAQATPPVIVQQPTSGISTGTAVALGVGALALVLVATR